MKDFAFNILFLLPFSLAQGSESEELAAASRLEDDLSFYQTASPDIAKLFEIETQVKRPALVLLKKEEEKLARFGKTPRIHYLLFLCYLDFLYASLIKLLFGRWKLH